MSGGYDLSTNCYSPDGRVYQVEYAEKAVEKSGTAIGIKCTDGVVLGVENVVHSKMLVSGSNRRVFAVDEHACVALAGLAADARKIVKVWLTHVCTVLHGRCIDGEQVAREECKEYRNTYGSAIPGHVLNTRLAAKVHSYTLYWWLRPFGTSILLGTYDQDGPQLYQIDPSGVGYRYFATAIGKAKNGASSELEKIDFTMITCRQAVMLIANIIYKLHDEAKDKEFELDLSWICDASAKRYERVPDDLCREAVVAAKAEKEREEMDEGDDEKA